MTYAIVDGEKVLRVGKKYPNGVPILQWPWVDGRKLRRDEVLYDATDRITLTEGKTVFESGTFKAKTQEMKDEETLAKYATDLQKKQNELIPVLQSLGVLEVPNGVKSK